MASKKQRAEQARQNRRFIQRRNEQTTKAVQVSGKPTLVESVQVKLDSLTTGMEERVMAKLKPDYIERFGKAFWDRCKEEVTDNVQLVDGYAAQCNWNTSVVARRSVGNQPNNANLKAVLAETNLKIYRGYAYHADTPQYPGGWYEHTWCMDNQGIIETTAAFLKYYGAALNKEELNHYAEGLPPNHDPTKGNGGLGWSINAEGQRVVVPANEVANTIGLPKVI